MSDYNVYLQPNSLPTLVYTSTTQNTGQGVTITNLSPTANVYVGSQPALQTLNATPPLLGPGQKVRVNLYPQQVNNIYGSPVYTPTTTTTTLSQLNTAGTTLFTVASSVPFVPGTLFAVGNLASSKEVLAVSGTPSTTSILATTASLYDHNNGSTVATVTAAGSSLRVTAQAGFGQV